MKIIKSILLFFLLIFLLFLMRVFSDFILFESISPIFDLIPFCSTSFTLRAEVAFFYFAISIFLFLIVKIFKKFEKNEFWDKFSLNFNKNFLLIVIIFVIIGFFSDIFARIIYFLMPLMYYYIFKRYFSDVFFINKFFIEYVSVKIYFIIILFLEIPFLIQLIISLFAQDYDGDDLTIYYMFSNVRYYFPILLASWFDSKKN